MTAKGLGALLVLAGLALGCSSGGEDGAGSTSTSAAVAVSTTGGAEPSVSLPEPLESLEAPLSALDAGCGSAAAWSAAADQVVAAGQRLLAAHRLESSLDDLVGTEVGEAAAAGLVDRAVHAACDEAPVPASKREQVVALARAGELSGTIDSLVIALTDASTRTGSPFWFHGDQLAQTIEAELLRQQQDELDVVVFGSSVALRAVDPQQLAVEMGGSSVWNASLAGLRHTVLPLWADEAEVRLPSPAPVVVLGLASFEGFMDCDPRQLETFPAKAERRARAFDSLPFLADEPGHVRLLGGVPPTHESPILQTARFARLAEGGRGRVAPAPPGRDVSRQQADMERTFADPRRCAGGTDALVSQVRDWVDQGRRVVVLALPFSSDLTEMHPEGDTAHDAVIDEWQATLTTAGAEFLDLTTLVGDDDMLDLTHVAEAGTIAITNSLAHHLTG